MKKFLFDTYKSVADKITPVLKDNDFKETGMLTPKQFVIAGDYLTSKYKTWSWARVSKFKAVSYLPLNKQMLEMKGISINDGQILNPLALIIFVFGVNSKLKPKSKIMSF